METVEIEGIGGKETIEIYPTKVKYVLNGWYTSYKLIEAYGIKEFLQFQDSMTVVRRFLRSVIKKPMSDIEIISNTMTIRNLEDIIIAAKKINEIESDVEGRESDGLTLEQSIVVMFIHLGGLTQNQILNLEYPFFVEAVKALQYRINYESVSHVLANPFVENAWDMVQEANPFVMKKEKKSKVTLQALHDLGLIGGKNEYA